jgi:hypothetical protein
VGNEADTDDKVIITKCLEIAECRLMVTPNGKLVGDDAH